MDDDDSLTLHDVRPEDRRTHELLEQILARLPDDDRRVALLTPVGSVVGGEAFTLAELYAFAARSGAIGAPLRQALAGMSPKACGQLFARWAKAPGIVCVGERRDGMLWRVVGCDGSGADFGSMNPLLPKREKLGEW